MEQTGNITRLAHQLDRVLKTETGGRENPCAVDLRALSRQFDFRGERMQLLLEYASPTGKSCLYPGGFWHLFRDYATKRISGAWSGMPQQAEVNAIDLMMFTCWNIHNYKIIFELPDMAAHESAADLFASCEEIGDFRGLLLYLDQSYVPALRACLKQDFNLSEEMIEAGLDRALEIFVDEGNMAGIEILAPIDPVEWRKGRPVQLESKMQGASLSAVPAGTIPAMT